jgi:hypothetical protein
MSQNPNGTGSLGSLNESQDSGQAIKNANAARDSLRAGEYSFSSSDQTLKNTIAAMNLLKR